MVAPISGVRYNDSSIAVDYQTLLLDLQQILMLLWDNVVIDEKQVCLQITISILF